MSRRSTAVKGTRYSVRGNRLGFPHSQWRNRPGTPRPERLRSAGLISLVYQPGAIRTATSSLGRLATDPPREGRSFLVLPHTMLADAGEAALGAPQGTFTEPGGESGSERLFGAGREW